jgi:uncharacterized protein YbjT (DUF2867 family)
MVSMKKAILFGASGLIGSYLLHDLLNNGLYDLVTVITRKNLDIIHPKLKKLRGDYLSLPELETEIVADDVFITLGTTQKKTPNRHQYYQADHDYPVAAARMAKEKGATAVFIVTTVGANAGSRSFYLRTKGETERDIIALDFPHAHVFRPSILLGKRKENRPMEKFFQKILPAINFVLTARLKKFRGIEARDVALAMNNAANKQSGKLTICHWQEIKNLL